MFSAWSQSTPLVPLFRRHQLIGDADADDRTHHGVRARGRQAEIPGAEIPDDRGDQQREHHRETRAAAHLQNQFDRQQRDDAERHRARGDEYADEVADARPDHGDVRLQRVRVDDRRDSVGGIVESVDEFKAEGGQQRDAQQ